MSVANPRWRTVLWTGVALGGLAAALAWLTPAAHGQEAPLTGSQGPRNCYGLNVVEVLEGSPILGFLDQTAGWWLFLCPAGEQPELEEHTELHQLLGELAASGPAATRFEAGFLAGLSARSLEAGLCALVNQIRSVSPPDPDDDRQRPAQEIARWWCETVAGQPYHAGRRRCDWEAAPLATRPAVLRREIQARDYPPATLKALHDAVKGVAAEACPRTP